MSDVIDDFADFLVTARRNGTPFDDILRPYLDFESRKREIFASGETPLQRTDRTITELFDSHTKRLRTTLVIDTEDAARQQQHYIMRPKLWCNENKSLAMVQSLRDYKHNFEAFSNYMLTELNWANVVVAGGAAIMPLLPVPQDNLGDLDGYYRHHEASSADIDLFLYGLDEEAAVSKVEEIVDALPRTCHGSKHRTILRTRNTVTVVGEYPLRHIQIVLRLYRSVSEILTGFDVDCVCVAYDGQQVYASPRAIVACMTRTNTIDLNRRSPTYEVRLAKYAKRGFAIFWPELQRDRVDPSIASCAANKATGLARLLILEKEPQRFKEISNHGRSTSNYTTYAIPYGPRVSPSCVSEYFERISSWLNSVEQLAEYRGLHRHPAFISTNITEIIEGKFCKCPVPNKSDDESRVLAKELDKRYVSGRLSFAKDDPGRQTVGSFYPLSPDGWTTRAYLQRESPEQ